MSNNVKVDRYELAVSPIFEIVQSDKSINVDIVLKAPTVSPTGQNINGVITDKAGNVLTEAFVQLYDAEKKLIGSTSVSQDGRYILNNVVSNTLYYVSAVAPSKVLSEQVAVSTPASGDVTANIALTNNTIYEQGVIEGGVSSNFGDKAAISGAKVSLYYLNNNSTSAMEELVAVTYTGMNGHYVFREVVVGNYTVKFEAMGYYEAEANASLVTVEEVIVVDTALEPEAFASKPAISGMVTDIDNNAIAGADVMLYAVDENEDVTLVATTETNIFGRYMFANLDDGKYRVVSNDSDEQDVVIERTLMITGPTIVEQNSDIELNVRYVTSANVIETPVIALKSNNTELATVNAYTVTGIKPGRVMITAYLADDPTVFVDYTVDVLNALSDVEFSNLSTGFLAKGDQFGNAYQTMVYGIQSQPATDLANNPYNREEAYWGYTFNSKYQFNTITYQARIFNDGGWFIQNDNGTASLKVQVHTEDGWLDAANVVVTPEYPYTNTGNEAVYTFTFDKVIGDQIRIIGRPYKHTSNLTFTAVGKYSVYYRTAPDVISDPAPDVDSFIIVDDQSMASTEDIVRVIGLNDITIVANPTTGYPYIYQGMYVFGLYGIDTGYITANVNVPEGGTYKAELRRIGGGNRVLKVDVNGYDDGTVYAVPDGGGITSPENAPIYEFSLDLEAGDNLLKLYSTAQWGPDFNQLTLTKAATPTAQRIIGINDVTVHGTAYVDSGTYVYLNREGDTGYITMTTNVPEGGLYKGELRYVSDGVRSMKIDVNGFDSGITYPAPIFTGVQPIENAPILEFEIMLDEGDNFLKMYAETGNAPDFNQLVLTKVGGITRTVNPSDLTLEGGAYFHRDLYVYGHLSGATVSMDVNVPYGGMYDVEYRYIGSGNRNFKITVNGNEDVPVHTVGPESYGSVEPEDAGIFNFEIELDQGDNRLVILSIGDGPAPNTNRLVFTKTSETAIIEAESSIWGGYVSVRDGFVTGFDKGSVTIPLPVPYKGDYEIGISYVSAEEAVGTLTINGVAKDMVFEPTNGITQADKVTKTTMVKLNRGDNSLTFS